MKPSTANYITTNYGQSYKTSKECKLDPAYIETKGSAKYLSTNPERYLEMKTKYADNPAYNWLWKGNGYSTNPENNPNLQDTWKLNKYDNIMGKDGWVAYRILGI
jgi:hypothetical protein